ncbi:MAG: hypothetical protein V4475_09685 [Pseudomonadota bacterium]
MSDNNDASDRQARLTVEDFAPHIGTEFIARHGDFEDRLTLVSATPSSRAPTDGFRHAFSLIFDGIRDDAMITNIIEIDHPVMGAQMLTPSAIGHSKTGGFRYEIVFS